MKTFIEFITEAADQKSLTAPSSTEDSTTPRFTHADEQAKPKPTDLEEAVRRVLAQTPESAETDGTGLTADAA